LSVHHPLELCVSAQLHLVIFVLRLLRIETCLPFFSRSDISHVGTAPSQPTRPVSQLPHYSITYRLLSSKIKSAYGSQDHCRWGPFVIQWLSDTAHLKLSLSVRINIRYGNLSSSSRNFTPKRPTNGGVLRELDRARTSKVLVWSRSLNPIDPIG
jgi:hypothetical protein